MRGRYTIIHYQMHLKEYSIGSHLCTNIDSLRISYFFALKIVCDYISAFQTETDRGLSLR